MISPGFIKIPKGISTWFLDTCVWSDVISSEKTRGKFVSFFQKNNILAGITQYSLLELTRVKSLIPKMDSLFFQMRHNIWIPLLYDELFDLELQNYPNNSDILFMAMSLITGEEENKYNKILEKLSTDPGVIQTRNEHLRFGDSNFMSLEKYKSNFPPSDGNNYSVKQADEFARQNGIDYFRRHNPDFLRQFKAPHETFLPEGLSSQYIRSLFIFYKFYLHGQSP
ncbi:MAG: hypothetical protein OEZ01_17655, partial [Candidatus Heimdallarchaeota archaeon]|nr:hypothetical protein [Candidatus Heimdallarchaeota archaeon]